jgi:glycosyltransferase involved in cell wall biosynthesis
LLAKRVDRIVTVSEFSRARLSERLGLSPDRIEVIWNGVGETFRPTSAGPDTPLPSALARRPYLTTLFTQETRKNLVLVLAAWRLARPHLPPDTVLAIIGGKGSVGVFGGKGAGTQEDEGIVRCGYLPDAMLPTVLSSGLGLVYPSLYEGFGLPALEAMACGSPVVVTRLTSLPEICGDAALYVDARDPEDLAATLRRLADDPLFRADLGRRGQERAARFSWDRAASQMDALLSSYV